MFGPLLLRRQFLTFLEIPNYLGKVLLNEISDDMPFLFVSVRPYFGLKNQRGNQPLS